MNRKRDSYDRIAVGQRVRQKRISIGLSQDELAERIDRAPKYCSDIERGNCGMSVETMISISKSLDIPLDYLIFGEISVTERKYQENEESALLHILSQCSKREREYAMRLLKIYVAAVQPGKAVNEKTTNSGETESPDDPVFLS